MNIIESKIHHILAAQPSKAPNLPKLPSGNIAKAIQAITGSTPAEFEFDRTGHVRHFAATGKSLFKAPYAGDPRAHAAAFLASSEVSQAFELGEVQLDEGVVDETSYGSRVDFAQSITLKDGRALRVRGGYLNVHLNKAGDIYNVTSTLKVFKPRKVLGKVISAEAAIANAKKHLEGLLSNVTGRGARQMASALNKSIETCSAKAELVLSEDSGRFDPVYEVNLSICEPRQIMHVLVMARTGKVVYHESKLHFSIASQRQQVGLARIPARGLLRIPDPKVALSKQIVDHYVDDLPDPTVLKNQRMTLLVLKNRKWVEVKAKADGSFNFDPVKEKDEFAAVVSFIALNTQLVWMERLGMKTKYEPIKVFINDPKVRDNAYLDPENWEIHLGVGSGIPQGLVVEIFLDLGVSWHENGHGIVTIQAPGKDLPGAEGGALHEATGDVLGQILISYLFRLEFGHLIGYPLTAADIKADARIIGAYALPPDGIRKQRNGKTMRDKTGEVHDDGEIVGAALADLLESMATAAGIGDDVSKLKNAIENYARIYLMALAIVPVARVTFRDMRRALITADQQLLSGANRAVIEAHFDKRGITNSVTQDKVSGGKSRRRRKAS